MQIILRQPLPPQHLLDAQPRLPIRQRGKEQETPDHNRQDDPRRQPTEPQTLPTQPFTDRSLSLPPSRGSGAAAPFVMFGRVRAAGFPFRRESDAALVFAGRFDVEDELHEGACDEGGGEVRGQVVVEEELAAHDEEGEVVGGPREEEEACAVIQAGAGSCLQMISSVEYIVRG